MYGEIVFYTHGSMIEYGGEIFPAGELTADILNFAPEDYRPIQRLLDRMKELSKQYEDTLDRGIAAYGGKCSPASIIPMVEPS